MNKKIIIGLGLFLLVGCTQPTRETSNDVIRETKTEKSFNSAYELTFSTPNDWGFVKNVSERSIFWTISKNGWPKIEMSHHLQSPEVISACSEVQQGEEFEFSYSKLLNCREENINGTKFVIAHVFSKVEGDHYSFRVYSVLDDDTALTAFGYSDEENDFSVFEEIIQSFQFVKK